MQLAGFEVLERHGRVGVWSYDLRTEEIRWPDGVYTLHGLESEVFTPEIDVIAEGVEIQAALELLKRANVRQFRRYYFHRPESVEAVLLHTPALAGRSMSSLSVARHRV